MSGIEIMRDLKSNHAFVGGLGVLWIDGKAESSRKKAVADLHVEAFFLVSSSSLKVLEVNSTSHWSLMFRF